MSTNHPLLSDRAIQIVAENRIRAAINDGEFDKLPGFGKPAAVTGGTRMEDWKSG